MSETGPRFVGTADASKMQKEAPKKADVKLSPEQQKVSDVMQESGERLVSDVVDAKEAAGEKLQKLHGKELVEAGKKQMIAGVKETIRTQFRWAVPLAILGGVGGGGAGFAMGGGRESAAFLAQMGAQSGAGLGVGIGYEVAPLRFNKLTKGNPDVSKVGVSDYLLGHGAAFGINTLIGIAALRYPRLMTAAQITGTLVMEAMNPITIRGLRDVIKGSREMKKGL